MVREAQDSPEGLDIQQLLECHYSHPGQVGPWALAVQGGPVPREKKGSHQPQDSDQPSPAPQEEKLSMLPTSGSLSTPFAL